MALGVEKSLDKEASGKYLFFQGRLLRIDIKRIFNNQPGGIKMKNSRKFRAILLCVFLAMAVTAASLYSQTLRIYHIDVEQADATLFVSPNGQTMLVDCGKNGHGDRIKAVMDEANVSQIDVFVCTHYHEDHYGGIDDLVRDDHVPVLEAYDRGEKNHISASRRNSRTYSDYETVVGEDAITLRWGDEIPFDPAVHVNCISSSGIVIGEDNPTTGIDENDMSISLLITYGQLSYFVGGDIEEPTESDIAERDLVLDVDIYQANHHGSHSSSSQSFMEDLSPSAIIISNGNWADYMHPRQVTLDLYSTLPGPPTVFQTNKYLQGGAGGNVPDAFIADPETTDEDGTILVTVDGTAGNYIVSYGANTTHTFQIKGSQSTSVVVIESLLPNPQGSDAELEEVTLKNNGSQTISLSGWYLMDRSGRRWDITSMGDIAAGESRTIRRNGQPMSLNNSGDEITLLDAGNVEQDRFEYSSSSKDVVINTGH